MINTQLKIYKSVVMSTNKSDIKYYSTSIENMKILNKYMTYGNLLVEIKLYNNLQDKKDNKPSGIIESSIIRFNKKGLRSKSENKENNIYRYEIIFQNISNNTNYCNTSFDRKGA